MTAWSGSAGELVEAQLALARAEPPPWRPAGEELAVGGCFVCFPRGLSGSGSRGDPAFAAAVVASGGEIAGRAIVAGEAGAPYEPGLLALREGPLLEAAVRALPRAPDVLLVNATGRDHPRRAGLALQLGALLDLPTAGVTDRALVAEGELPGAERGARSPLSLDGEVVGFWLRTRRGGRPLVAHAAWRTSPEVAADVALGATRRARTPEPLRQARRLAREARASRG